MINEQLARGSNLAIYFAMFVYTLAFFAHVVEWVRGGRSRTAVADVPARELVSVGAAADREPGRPRIPEPAVHNGDFQADRWGRMAVSLTVLGFGLHLASVVLRGAATHRAPWGNLYEFSLAGSCVATAIYLFLAWKASARWLGVFLTGTVTLILGLAITVLYTDAEQLVPALHSYWLVIHVTAAVISSGAFTVGSVATALFLFKDRYERRERVGAARQGSMWQRVPSAAKLDLTAYKVLAFAFPIWTFTVIAGAIWAERAWGRYWGWDPTETWAFITWVVYAAYLHARATHGWKGRNAAIIALLGFAAFLFNYFGVSIFINGLHSYAGV